MNAMTTALPALSNLSPAVAIHLTAAVLATALGPVALWARRSQAQRPRLHRAAGYAWVTLMVLAIKPLPETEFAAAMRVLANQLTDRRT